MKRRREEEKKKGHAGGANVFFILPGVVTNVIGVIGSAR
jgi:hypothetical protein